MSAAARLVTVLSFVLSALLVQAPAWACRCAEPQPGQDVASSDVVFTGTVLLERADEGVGGARHWTVEVEGVEKGELGPRVAVVSDDSSCSAGFEVGARYRIRGDWSGGEVTANLCSVAGAQAVVGAPPRVPEQAVDAPFRLVPPWSLATGVLLAAGFVTWLVVRARVAG